MELPYEKQRSASADGTLDNHRSNTGKVAADLLVVTEAHPGREIVERLLSSTLVHNIVSLYGTQVASYLFPFITVPYLARVLGVHYWGLVAFAQAFGGYVGLVVEFGFNLSATRDVARHRNDPGRLSDVLAGVLGAKLVLILASLLVAFAAQYWLRNLRDHPVLLWAGVTVGIAQALSVTWFYQGLERMRTAAVIDVISKAMGVLGVFLLVHSPTHAWRVLVIQAVVSLIGTSILLVMAYREVRFRWPSLAGTGHAMRTGGSMFLFRSAVSLYTTANALILGVFAPLSSVGYYAGAEKLVRALLGVFSPISQSLYPRINDLLSHSQDRAARLVRISFAVMGGGSLVMMLGLWFAAPYIIRIVLGPGFDPAAAVLRILAVLLPAITFSNVLGTQWMLPLGMDCAFNIIIVSCGALNVGAAILLAPRYAHLGMASSVAGCESLVSVAMFVLLWQRHRNPLARTYRLSEFHQ
jgi:polysaccharide transporter, PST family